MKDKIIEKWLPLMTYGDNNTIKVDPENYEECSAELEHTEKSFKFMCEKNKDILNKCSVWSKEELIKIEDAGLYFDEIQQEFLKDPIRPAVIQVRRAWAKGYNGVLVNKKPILTETGTIILEDYIRNIKY